MNLFGYYVPRAAAAVALVSFLAAAGGLYLLVRPSSPSLAPPPRPTTTAAVLSAGAADTQRQKRQKQRKPQLRGYVSEVSGLVVHVVCQGQGKKRSCHNRPLAKSKVVFLADHPPNQGKRLYVTTDAHGRFDLRLRTNTYTVVVFGWRRTGITLTLAPTEVRILPTLYVSTPARAKPTR